MPLMPESKTEKVTRVEVERMEGVVSRCETRLDEANANLSTAKDRQKAAKKKPKKTTVKKAKGKGTRKKKAVA